MNAAQVKKDWSTDTGHSQGDSDTEGSETPRSFEKNAKYKETAFALAMNVNASATHRQILQPLFPKASDSSLDSDVDNSMNQL